VLLEILDDFLDVGLGINCQNSPEDTMDGVSKSATRFLNSEETNQILFQKPWSCN